MTSRHGAHTTAQTAFRLPEGLLAWLREQAAREGGGQTMTGIVARALERERDRCTGITTSTAPAGPVSPPRKPRTARKPPAPGPPVSLAGCAHVFPDVRNVAGVLVCRKCG